MGRTFRIYCDDETSQAISSLARTYDLTEREVVHQLLEIGLEDLERLEHV